MTGPFKALILVVTAAAAVGCGCGHSSEIDPGAAKQISDINTIAVRVHGDYDKLTPEEKQQVLKTYGDENNAKRILMLMANPPNAGSRAAHGQSPN